MLGPLLVIAFGALLAWFGISLVDSEAADWWVVAIFAGAGALVSLLGLWMLATRRRGESWAPWGGRD